MVCWLFTRWDCYKELGCPEITSEDEYLDVLKQMVDAHPETEDGKKVYALSGWTDWGLWPYKISYPFSFGYENLDNNQLFSHVTGELEDMFTKEDGIFWKSLSFFNKAYRMGIMDPEAFTMKTPSTIPRFPTGRSLLQRITGIRRMSPSAGKMQACMCFREHSLILQGSIRWKAGSAIPLPMQSASAPTVNIRKRLWSFWNT